MTTLSIKYQRWKYSLVNKVRKKPIRCPYIIIAVWIKLDTFHFQAFCPKKRKTSCNM